MSLTTDHILYSIDSNGGVAWALVVTDKEIGEADFEAFCDKVTDSMGWCSGKQGGWSRYFSIERYNDEEWLQGLIKRWSPPGPMVHGFQAEPIDILGNITRPLDANEDQEFKGGVWRITYSYASI